MRKSAVVILGTVIGATCVAPAAYAHRYYHRHHHKAAMMMAPMANPRMDAMGQFYATPMSAGAIGIPGANVIPGLGIATGVVNGVAQPILGPGGVGSTVLVPGLDAAGNIVNGVTKPLLPPT